jgi:hypothetical protein
MRVRITGEPDDLLWFLAVQRTRCFTIVRLGIGWTELLPVTEQRIRSIAQVSVENKTLRRYFYRAKSNSTNMERLGLDR